MSTQLQDGALPSDAESYSTLQPAPHSPVKTRGSGRRGRYKIPLTVPSLPRFDYSPEEVARYTRAAFVPFFDSISPCMPSPHSAPDSLSSSIQELEGRATDLEMINGLDESQCVDSHVVSGEQDSSSVLSVASSIQDLNGGVTKLPVVSNAWYGPASLCSTLSIHEGAAAHQDTSYYAPDLPPLRPPTGLPDVSKAAHSDAGRKMSLTSQAVRASVSDTSPVQRPGGNYVGSPLSDGGHLQWLDSATPKSFEETIHHDLELLALQSTLHFNDDYASTRCVSAGNTVPSQDSDQCPSIKEGPEEHSDPVNYLESLWNLRNKIKAKKTEPSLF